MKTVSTTPIVADHAALVPGFRSSLVLRGRYLPDRRFGTRIFDLARQASGRVFPKWGNYELYGVSAGRSAEKKTITIRCRA
jgi:hypothetical protein